MHYFKGVLGKFLFRKTRILTFSGFKLALSLLTISPLVEKILSEGTDVAGIDNRRLATFFNRGNRYWFTFHHSKGFVSGDAVGSLTNMYSSSDIVVQMYCQIFLGLESHLAYFQIIQSASHVY